MPLLFWSSTFLLFYIYLGYPLLIWVWATVRPRPFRRGDVEGSVSVILAAYNEASRLPPKIASLRAADPKGRILEILIGSDGSSDASVQVVEALNDPLVRFFAFPARRGKPSVLNDLVQEARGDCLVFTDARQELGEGAIEKLLSGFADPEVGVISGDLFFRKAGRETAVGEGVGTYWRYEKSLRRSEALVGSVPGATGALYAMRRHLFRPLPEEILLDDVVLPMQAMAQGYRCVFEPSAMIFDEASVTPKQESIRKRRTIGGCFQLIQLYPAWLTPGGHPAWFQFLSHKVLRLASPFLLILLLVTNGVLAFEPGFYRCLCALQGLAYALAAVGELCQRATGRAFGLGPFVIFVALNRDTLLAAWDAARGRFDVKWAAAEGRRRSEGRRQRLEGGSPE